jgi:hypothetical protein
MPRTTTALLSTLLLLALAADSPAEEKPLTVDGMRPVRAAEQRRIRALVARLADLGHIEEAAPTSTRDGVGFAPLADEPTDRPAALAVRELVGLGPIAMPFLLEHLDDATLTGARIETGGFGGVFLGRELESNPSRTDELAAVRKAVPDHESNGEPADGDLGPFIDEHTFTVGDVCFVMLGHITNRRYAAERYQPTACHVVNSPTRTACLARAVRAQWAGKDVRRELFRRLLHDFRTPPEGSWRAGDGCLQAGALLRLAWFFPDESRPVVTGYLAGLDERKLAETTDPDTGIILWRLIDDLCRIDRSEMRYALAPLIWKTTNRDIVTSLLDVIPDDRSPRLLEHIKATMAANVRRRHRSSYRWLFREIRRRWPDRVRETLLWHLRKHQYAAIRDIVETAYIEGMTVPVETWATLLGMTQKAVPWTRDADPHPIERLRVCDVAAVEIAKQRPDLPFDEEADEKARDAAIGKLREALAKEGIR